MKFLIFILSISFISGKLLVTKEYTEYLKKTVDWEVVDYEQNIFKGWTDEDAKMLLGAVEPTKNSIYIPPIEVKNNLPSSISWQNGPCNHPVRNQGGCGSCWAFGLDGMLSDRCCLNGFDYGWLSPQELVSCDKGNGGCGGGWPGNALNYVVQNRGLLRDQCFPYVGQNVPCPYKCVNGWDWKASHVCFCTNPKSCQSAEALKMCLNSGPVEVVFGVCESFFSYKSGVYKCDCNGKYVGLHAVTAVGYYFSPEWHFIVRNSWGADWGDAGHFKMAQNSCGIDGSGWSNSNVMCERVGRN